MQQKIIQVGNSLAVTIPASFVQSVGLKAGQEVLVEQEEDIQALTIQPKKNRVKTGGITPEFLQWLKEFNRRHKDVLTELAKR